MQALKDAPKNISDNAKAAANRISETSRSIKDSIQGVPVKPVKPGSPPREKKPKAPKPKKRAPKPRKPKKPKKPKIRVAAIPEIKVKEKIPAHLSKKTPKEIEYEKREEAELKYIENLVNHLQTTYAENHSQQVKQVAKLLEVQQEYESRVKKNEALAKHYMARASTKDPQKLQEYIHWAHNYYVRKRIKETQKKLKFEQEHS